ncbi:hypothetical protein [Nocardia brasiliensis]
MGWQMRGVPRVSGMPLCGSTIERAGVLDRDYQALSQWWDEYVIYIS